MKHMKIVIGLGNPGLKYQATRHNAGFLVVDELAANDAVWHRQGASLSTQILLTLPNGSPEKIILIKPQTFMNRSGAIVQTLKKKYPKTGLGDWYVIYDDLDIALGQFKIEFGHGPKQHNGLTSLYEQLGTNQFWHVRVGVDYRHGLRQISGSDYVLQNFSPDEKDIFALVKTQAVRELRTLWQTAK